MSRVSIVIPCHNETASLPKLHAELSAMAEGQSEAFGFVYVDDGSTDTTAEIVAQLAAEDPRVELVCLSRNFGHEAASTAGLDYASGDAVVLIDADGQDPPSVIPTLLEKFHEGYDVVAAQRTNATGEGWFKPLASRCFYRVLRLCSDVDIPVDTGDFRLMSRQAIDALKQCRETSRFVRGLSSWVGYRQTIVPFVRHERQAGKSNYSIFKLTRLATDAILGFSDVPLRLCLALTSVVGLFLLLASFGWTIMQCPFLRWMASVELFGATVLMSLTIAGLYIGKLYRQAQNRPLYLIDYARSLMRDGQGESNESDA
ncbi:MAG: glycosyltransferase family 2 protein [Phycisphaerales bacterium]|jgi:polyisoprenyl-phosphate glycosyltransferase|nr:glycosyltransferase family 2 protein [Phycisphaerales bacterium]MBT7170749.1 glycosyltransferase family 2 protein [Phycisphaerales bacterium]